MLAISAQKTVENEMKSNMRNDDMKQQALIKEKL